MSSILGQFLFGLFILFFFTRFCFYFCLLRRCWCWYALLFCICVFVLCAVFSFVFYLLFNFFPVCAVYSSKWVRNKMRRGMLIFRILMALLDCNKHKNNQQSIGIAELQSPVLASYCVVQRGPVRPGSFFFISILYTALTCLYLSLSLHSLRRLLMFAPDQIESKCMECGRVTERKEGEMKNVINHNICITSI